MIAAHQTMLAPPALPYDAEVEYIESTGTQYVDTGYYPNNTTTCKMSFKVISQLNKHFNALFFCGDAYNSANAYGAASNMTYGEAGTSKKINIYRTSSAVNVYLGNPNLSRNVRYDITLGTSNATITDGTNTYNSTFTSATFPTTARSLYVLCGNTGTADLAEIGNIMLFSFQIFESGVLVRDFQPVRVGQVGYIYDRVSGTLFGNAGTGAFPIGPDK